MSATAKPTERALEDLSDAEFEALLQERRGAMKGLEMTEEQRCKALAYSGSIDHRGADLPRR